MPALVGNIPSQASAEPQFSVVHQKVSLELDPLARRIVGQTEITISPFSADLKHVRLHCRQAQITLLKFSSRATASTPYAYVDPYSLLKLSYQSTADHNEYLRTRLENHDSPLGPKIPELDVTVPKSVKISELGNTIVLDTSKKGDATTDSSQANKNTADQGSRFTPLTIYITFVVKNVREGLHFVGWDPDDMRYPHVYTQNASVGAMSGLFPCVDSASSKCTWEVSLKTPRTIGDAMRIHSAQKSSEYRLSAEEKLQSLSEEDKGLDLLVTCSGDLTDEIVDPKDSTRKTTSFTCSTAMAPHQIGFAIGPFEEVNLTSFRESDEDERLGRNAIPLHAFCLPGRAAEVQNTCFPLAKAMDFFVTSYGSFPFSSYKLCFVDELLVDHFEAASLSICCSRMLFPANVIDPMYPITRELVFALASQWSGVNITPAEPTDLWAVIGLAYYMADMFLRKLSGLNEFRFQQKLASGKVCKIDVGRPSIFDSGAFVAIDRSYYDLIALKAPLVLFILDRRLTKASGSNGLSRIVSKILLNANVGDLPNGMLSTAHMIRTCERTGHTKLEAFFAQWIYGLGYPSFNVSQKFNKKKLVVEITITQEEKGEVTDEDIKPHEFMREVREENNGIFQPLPQSFFTGPMTIRIHEADGTPYEHIVEIKDRISRLEIPYNTKYKRLKRSRRQREKTVTGNAVEMAVDGQEDALVYSLGDILQSEQEMRDWRFGEWGKEEEDRMSQESYEWLRLDADFEWICKLSVNMPAWMYVSQLQQDRDVVAQYETVRWLAIQPSKHSLVPTILVRTFLDVRYFHGIRTAAVEALGDYAAKQQDSLAMYHLDKAFRELFCEADTRMIKANDFSDYPTYFLQCAFPRAVAAVRSDQGRSPLAARKLLYEMLRYNDNGENEFSDCFYVATVMKGLADAVASAPLQSSDDTMMADDDDDFDFLQACLLEIDKQRRRDEWIPTYHNILSSTALACRHELAKAGCIPKHPVEFLQYAQHGGFEDLRISAFDHLLDLGYGRTNALISFLLSELGTELSPYVRRRMLDLLGRFLGSVAIGVDQGGQKTKEEIQDPDELIIEQTGSTEAHEREKRRRNSVGGAVAALKDELKSHAAFKEAIWNAINSSVLTLSEIQELLMICSFIYDKVDSVITVLHYPRYWQRPELERIPSTNPNANPRYLLKFKKGRVRTKKMGAPWVPSSQKSAGIKRENSVSSTKGPSLKIRLPSATPMGSASPTISTPQTADGQKRKFILKGPKLSGSPLP